MYEDLKIPDDIMALYSSFLKEKKLRKTEERDAILHEICSSHKHIDIDSLYDKFRDTKYHISKSTLYNTLELLVESGIIVRHQVNVNVKSEYELRKRAEKHIHLVCNGCGAFKEIKLNNDLLKSSVMGLNSRFLPDYFSVYVYGTCDKCVKKQQNKKK